jgi:neutral ceramidase
MNNNNVKTKNMRIIVFIAFYSFMTVPYIYGNEKEIKNEPPGWKAGVARVVITPEEPMWMSGYAARNKPSEGTIHDLWAKALAFEDEKGEISVLITADIVGFRKGTSDRIRDQLKTRFGLSKSQVILNASHTHSGPLLLSGAVGESRISSGDRIVGSYLLNEQQAQVVKEYSSKFENQIVNLVGKALGSMQPVDIYAENGVTRFQVNRRNNNESTLSRQAFLNGPNEYAVPVIKVVNKKGDLLSIVFGYACHNTVLSGYEWSGDYAGFAQLELEKKYPGVTALFFQGAGADQNPLPRRTVALAQQYGEELAAAVERVINEDMRKLPASLKTAYSEVDLQFKNPPPTKEELLQIMDESSDYPRYLKVKADVLHSQLEKGESIKTSYPYPVQVWQLGDQKIVSLGGELVIDYAIELKRIFGRDAFVMGYSNDVMAYIPSARIIEEGGYEGSRSAVFTTPWHPNIENRIIHEVVQLANQMNAAKANQIK